MDIRRYFGGASLESDSKKKAQEDGKGKKKTRKNKRVLVLDSDSDEDASSSISHEAKRKKGILPDSDFEDDSPKGKDTKGRSSSKNSSKSSSRNKTKTAIDASDFFGSAPVRSSANTTSVSKKDDDKADAKCSKNGGVKRKSSENSLQERWTSPRKKKTAVVDLASPEKSPSVITKNTAGNKTPQKKSATPKKEGVESKSSPRVSRSSPRKEESVTSISSKLSAKAKHDVTPQKKAVNGSKTSQRKVAHDDKKAGTPKSDKMKPDTKTENSTSASTPSSAGKKNYWAYKQREAPRSLGSKEVPEGADNCFEGLTFVITGVLEAFDRDDVKSLVEKYGGRVIGSVSKKTSYIVVGRDAGEKKLELASKHKTKQIDEDGLLELIKITPGKKSKYGSSFVSKQSASCVTKTASAATKLSTSITEPPSTSKTSTAGPSASTGSVSSSGDMKSPLMLVDKYTPKNLKQIIGQQGEKSCANKLKKWLSDWARHNTGPNKKKPAYAGGGFFRGPDDGAGFRAALLSGPPGVGKTTTATLVARELGYTYVELNASDTRSKKSVKEVVSELVTSHSMSGMSSRGSVAREKHCLLMDEVDGMAGNEDRGGIQEVIQLIKTTKVPIICMCNDRNHQKIRSLANYCFDLRFHRPRAEQIKAAVMSIAFKEGLSISPPAVQQIIVGANQDVRQVLHNLAMWSAATKSLTFEGAKEKADKAKKDIKLGPFDVARLVFSHEGLKTVDDKLGLFFNDYSIGPLFVQENYVHVQPYGAGSPVATLQALSRAADSISQGDLVDSTLRSKNNWSLLPQQAVFSSFLPGEYMRGAMRGMIQFPTWLGNNSRRGKVDRLLQELHTHMHLRVSGSKLDLAFDYLPHLRNELTTPLIKEGQEGIPKVLDVMSSYYLRREDLDSVMEVTSWGDKVTDPYTKVDSKVKAAFTRAYNRGVHLLPYSTSQAAKKGRAAAASASAEDGLEDGEEGEEMEEDNSDVETDSMIKAKKPAKATSKAATSKGAGGGGRGGGKGRGRGKGK